MEVRAITDTEGAVRSPVSIIVIGSDIDWMVVQSAPNTLAYHSAPQQQGRGVQCSRGDDNRAGIDDLSIGETHSDGVMISTLEQHAIDDRVRAGSGGWRGAAGSRYTSFTDAR